MNPTADGTVEDGHGNVVERVVDHGDGTATRTTYDTDGQVTGTEAVTGLPVAEPVAVPPTDAEIEAARLSLAAATTVSQTKARALALDDLRAAQIAAITT